MEQIEVLYEDEEVLVCGKPAGIAVETARTGQQDMVSLLRNRLAKERGNAGGEIPYVGVVHRLDQPVEGVMVFAKSKRAAAELSRQVSGENGARAMRKWYCALVCLPEGERPETRNAGEGENAPEREFVLEDELVRDGRTNTSHVAASGEAGAKRAVLTCRLAAVREAEEGRTALAFIRLMTGRHHQIRVQMAHAGLPLLGDVRYGSGESRRLGEALGIRSVALCACRLCFFHPRTGREMEFHVMPRGSGFSSFLPEIHHFCES